MQERPYNNAERLERPQSRSHRPYHKANYQYADNSELKENRGYNRSKDYRNYSNGSKSSFNNPKYHQYSPHQRTIDETASYRVVPSSDLEKYVGDHSREYNRKREKVLPASHTKKEYSPQPGRERRKEALESGYKNKRQVLQEKKSMQDFVGGSFARPNSSYKKLNFVQRQQSRDGLDYPTRSMSRSDSDKILQFSPYQSNSKSGNVDDRMKALPANYSGAQDDDYYFYRDVESKKKQKFSDQKLELRRPEDRFSGNKPDHYHHRSPAQPDVHESSPYLRSPNNHSLRNNLTKNQLGKSKNDRQSNHMVRNKSNSSFRSNSVLNKSASQELMAEYNKKLYQPMKKQSNRAQSRSRSRPKKRKSRVAEVSPQKVRHSPYVNPTSDRILDTHSYHKQSQNSNMHVTPGRKSGKNRSITDVYPVSPARTIEGSLVGQSDKTDLFLYPEEFKDLYQNVCKLDAINIYSEFIEYPFLLVSLIQESFILIQKYVNDKIANKLDQIARLFGSLVNPQFEDDLLRVLRRHGDRIRDVEDSEWVDLRPEIESCLLDVVRKYNLGKNKDRTRIISQNLPGGNHCTFNPHKHNDDDGIIATERSMQGRGLTIDKKYCISVLNELFQTQDFANFFSNVYQIFLYIRTCNPRLYLDLRNHKSQDYLFKQFNDAEMMLMDGSLADTHVRNFNLED